MISNGRSVFCCSFCSRSVLFSCSPPVKIGVAYSINGTRLLPGQMPSTLEDLNQVKVEYETMPGWKESIEGCTDFDSLPDNAKAYVHRIEELAGCPVSWIGTGPKREQMVQNFE